MKTDEERYELIERYLAGKLSEEEAEQVGKRMQTDEQFAEEVRMHQLAEELIVDRELLEVKDKLRKMMEEGREHSEKVSIPFWKQTSVRAAATVALLLGLGVVMYMVFLKTGPTNKELVAKYFEPAVYADVRTADTSKNTTLDTAMQFYKVGNYPKASNYFRKIIHSNSASPDVYFFYGNTLLALRDLEKARFYLQKTVESGKTIYRQEALWYLALAHLAEGNREQCRKLLETLISEGEGPYREKAERLLGEME